MCYSCVDHLLTYEIHVCPSPMLHMCSFGKGNHYAMIAKLFSVKVKNFKETRGKFLAWNKKTKFFGLKRRQFLECQSKMLKVASKFSFIIIRQTPPVVRRLDIAIQLRVLTKTNHVIYWKVIYPIYLSNNTGVCVRSVSVFMRVNFNPNKLKASLIRTSPRVESKPVVNSEQFIRVSI